VYCSPEKRCTIIRSFNVITYEIQSSESSLFCYFTIFNMFPEYTGRYELLKWVECSGLCSKRVRNGFGDTFRNVIWYVVLTHWTDTTQSPGVLCFAGKFWKSRLCIRACSERLREVILRNVSISRRGCINNPAKFCFICSKFAPMKQRRKVTAFVKKAYHAYLERSSVGDQDKTWAPRKACRTSIERLRQWMNGDRNSLPFGIPVVWREPSDHGNDCYFRSCNVKG
jgi:hypothetical protein